jgi:hypothetical protein
VSVRITETIHGKPSRIDEAAGVIYGVKVLGRVSKNGREYSNQAMDDSTRLYEGVAINIDHPDRARPDADRSFRDVFGELRSVKRDGDGVFADLHYLRSHPMAAQVIESANRFPDKFGLSHNADGITNQTGGVTVVESVEAVHSVDIVSRPATNRGIFESENPVTVTKTKRTIRKIFETAFPKRKKFLREMDDAAVPAMDMATEVETPADADSDDQIKAAFRAAVIAAFDDGGLDSVATLAKIKTILKAYDSLAAEEKPVEKSEKEEEPVAESHNRKPIDKTRKLLESLASRMERFERNSLIHSVLSESGIDIADIEPARRKLLESQSDEDGMRALIASWPGHVRTKRRTRLPESTGGGKTEYPADSKGFAAAIRN